MFGKPRPPTAPPPPPAGPPPSRRFTDGADSAVTVIGPGTHIKGHLSGDDAIDIGGMLEGDSTVTGLCRIREGARVTGDVSAASIVVDGDVHATTLVADKVEIGATARVHATVRARVVAIAEGAFFDGQVQMEGRDGPALAATFKEKRRGRGEDGEPSTTRGAQEPHAAADERKA
jgi:cytoskeletal protein CcmA (bactofilin family)